MTIEIDAALVGTISSVMAASAVAKGERAIEYALAGDAVHAFFYAEWATRHARCALEIDPDAI